MAQDRELCRKKGSKRVNNEPAHGPPLQARVAAANGTVLQLANMLQRLVTILAHMEMDRGKAKQTERNGAKTLRRAVGMAGKTQPAEQSRCNNIPNQMVIPWRVRIM